MGFMGKDLVLTSDLDKLYYRAGQFWFGCMVILLIIALGRYLLGVA